MYFETVGLVNGQLTIQMGSSMAIAVQSTKRKSAVAAALMM